MDVRIGVIHTPREIEVELSDDTDHDALAAQVEEALSTQEGVLWVTDRRGRRVGVPAARLAYVEIGSPGDERRVGFGVQ
ncbi:MAG TPA: DUF3107 domain-containing protein [Acidimicrobiales bacterium]|nr:DUF3107 domain-containing protein [Acidimicrobiales bacterium]